MRYIFFILLISSLFGQIKEKESRTFFSKLFKFGSKSEYEDGYWIDKWFRSREFATPVNIIPIEIRYGIGANGKTTGSATNLTNESFKDDPRKIIYESDVTPVSQGIENIWGPSIEIDFGLINLPSYIVGTSWVNIMTGLSYRNSSLFAPAYVPYEEWGANNITWGDTAYFFPKVNDYLVTTHLQYQPFNKWYLNFRYSYGISSALFYSSDKETWNKTLTGSGTSAVGGIGLRYILDPGKRNRFTVGIDFRYSYTKIHTIIDPDDITPINREGKVGNFPNSISIKTSSFNKIKDLYSHKKINYVTNTKKGKIRYLNPSGLINFTPNTLSCFDIVKIKYDEKKKNSIRQVKLKDILPIIINDSYFPSSVKSVKSLMNWLINCNYYNINYNNDSILVNFFEKIRN